MAKSWIDFVLLKRRGTLLRLIYLLFFITTFSFAIPVKSCTPAEKASISCNGANEQCFVDVEEYVNGSPKNIPHCVKTFSRTWTIDTSGFTSGLAKDYYHIYVKGNPGVAKDLFTALDDRAPGVTQRVINGKLNTRVNGDMATIGATVMIPQGSKYNFNQGATKTSSITTEKEYVNDGSFAASSYTLCQGDFVYDPNKFSYCKNSASSTFDFSEKGTFIQNNLTGKNVVYARLYWGGSAYQNWKVSSGSDFIPSALSYIKGYSRIDFKAPNMPVITIDADPKDIFWFGSFSEYQPGSMTNEVFKFGAGDASYKYAVKSSINYIYSASADVTDIVKRSLGKTEQDRTFYAGNIRSTTMSIKNDFLAANDTYFYGTNGHYYHLDNRKVLGSLLFAPVEGKNGYWGIFIAPQFAAWSLVIIYDFDDETAIKERIEPKLVSIYDGLAKLAPDLSKKTDPVGTIIRSSVNTKFDNIYTPKAGNIDASLTMFSYGGKIEVDSEDIEIKKNGNYESITSGHNAKGEQFNSTMTKFGNPINSGRVYNNLVDLDIFDISDKMSCGQKEADIKFTVATKRTSVVSIERIYLALAGFSTRIYRPDVCYTEYIYAKRPSQSNFMKIERQTPTKVPINTILKTFVEVTNNTNEDAENFALKATLNQSQTYNPNSTYILSNKSPRETGDFLAMAGLQHFNDNTGLQQLNGNNITFYLGKYAAATKGGTMLNGKQNYAYASYETILQSNFIPTKYKATIANSDINLVPYDTYIKKCDDYKYDITIGVDEPNDFIPSSKSDDGSAAFKNRLLTQIVSKPFDVYITNYGTDGSKRAPDSPVDVKVELVDSCSATSNLYEKNIKFNDQSEILLSNIKIDKAYRSVKFRISHPNPTKKTNPTAPENIVACENLDEFAIRPSHFSLWDTSTDAIYAGTNSLVGGAIHDNIALAAMSPNNTGLANGYINNLGANEINLTPKSSATCDPTILNEENKLSVNFNNINKAVAKILRQTSSGSVGFSYSDIGDTTLEVLDSSYTRKDQDTIHGDDCVKGSDENDPTKDPEGRIGCNIKLKGNSRYIFNPKDIQISNLKIEKDDEVTYLDSEGVQKAKLTFDVVAKLGNNQAARLYKDGCYARATSFDIKLDRVPLNFTDNDGNAGTLAKANDELLFFEIPSSNTKKLTDPSATKWTFYVGRSSFQNGEAHGEINFNFVRKINRAKNPFTVSSDDFSFSGLSDGKTSSAPYTKPVTAQKTSAKFYYGRVYAPYYEGPASGFNAKIYYGAYCDGCDKNIYMKNGTKKWEIFPSTISWYTNPTHHAGVLQFGDFRFANNTTLKDNVSAVNNGEQLIFVSNQRPVVDIASMLANSWLLYNEFSENAQTNDFTLKFLVPNGDWAGKTLGRNSNTGDVGKVIGAEGNFKDLSDKTNRRISW